MKVKFLFVKRIRWKAHAPLRDRRIVFHFTIFVLVLLIKCLVLATLCYQTWPSCWRWSSLCSWFYSLALQSAHPQPRWTPATPDLAAVQHQACCGSATRASAKEKRTAHSLQNKEASLPSTSPFVSSLYMKPGLMSRSLMLRLAWITSLSLGPGHYTHCNFHRAGHHTSIKHPRHPTPLRTQMLYRAVRCRRVSVRKAWSLQL